MILYTRALAFLVQLLLNTCLTSLEELSKTLSFLYYIYLVLSPYKIFDIDFPDLLLHNEKNIYTIESMRSILSKALNCVSYQ